MTLPSRPVAIVAVCALIGAGGCDAPLDLDFRGVFGDAPSTADAARRATAERPEPDSRGIISYPGYQVAVARRGDTVADVAARIGTDAGALARFNGLEPGDRLRGGEIIALPTRVAEPAGGPIRPPGSVDIAALAGDAIDEADASAPQVETAPLEPAPETGLEPVRHKVERGETAYSIARLYDVSLRALAEWNGLDSDFTVREGQYLLIPVVLPEEEALEPLDAVGSPEPAAESGEPPATEPAADGEPAMETAATEPPGGGSQTPTPPSAAKPLPDEETAPAAEPVETVAAPDLSDSQTEAETGARLAYPLRGDIVREYAKGRNDGIDIAAGPGTPVTAAAGGVVAAITEDTNGRPIIVVKHPDNLLTVYSNVGAVAVEKGASVRRGETLAEIASGSASALHFEVREGFDSVDPMSYLK